MAADPVEIILALLLLGGAFAVVLAILARHFVKENQ